MKIILTISLLLALFSCECVNNYETPKENIPEQNSNLQLLNLSNNFKILESYSNDIYIEDIKYKEVKSNSSKYISGNSVLNLRYNDKVVLASGMKLEDNSNYFGVIYDNNNSVSSIYKESLGEENFRIWNLNNESSSIRIFKNDFLENYEVPIRNTTEKIKLPNGSYSVIYTRNSQIIESNLTVSSNYCYELCLIKDEILTIEVSIR